MYTAIFCMEDIGTFGTFAEAFKVLYDVIKENLASENRIGWMELETAVWVKTPEGQPIYFPEARDRMCKEGFLVNGKWVDHETI